MHDIIQLQGINKNKKIKEERIN